MANLSGKILRVNLDGTIPADNPFYGQKGKRGEIWAYGLRNPWKFAFDAKGRMAIADVGLATYEEINIGKKARITAGQRPKGRILKISKALFIRLTIILQKAARPSWAENFSSSISRQIQKRLFFGDFVKNFIRHIRFDSKGKVVWVKTFDKSAGWMTDISFGPDGSLYYAVGDSGSAGHIQKISYTAQ